MSNLKAAAEARREEVENTLTGLGVEMILNRQARMRVQQAIRRDPQLADLLDPVKNILDRNHKFMQSKQSLLGAVWEDKNLTGW